jgi:hypothetical protein
MDSTTSQSHLLSRDRQATFTAHSEAGQAARTATVTLLVGTEIVPDEALTYVCAVLSEDDWEKLKLDQSISQEDWKAEQGTDYESMVLGDWAEVDMSTVEQGQHFIYVNKCSGL